MFDWAQLSGFDWDRGNARKNATKHDVAQSEAEQVFFNQILVLSDHPFWKYSIIDSGFIRSLFPVFQNQ